jgi:hypothetical protein
MNPKWRWALIAGVVGAAVGMPVVLWRMDYAHGKRLRELIPGRIWRSGQMTADGFEDAIDRCGFRTIINLQEDCVDPDLSLSFWDWRTVKESALCARRGVRYLVIQPDLVPPLEASGRRRPAAIDQLLAVLDDDRNYPVLLHCRAGLHRTGVLSAVVRMEYQGWSNDRAFRELKEHGFGEWPCTASNLYVAQYVLNYQRGLRFPVAAPTGAP